VEGRAPLRLAQGRLSPAQGAARLARYKIKSPTSRKEREKWGTRFRLLIAADCGLYAGMLLWRCSTDEGVRGSTGLLWLRRIGGILFVDFG
jgi:hypothetical protein